MRARGSGGELLAAAQTAGVQDLAASLGCHARAEPMATLANKVRRLKGPFHGSLQNIIPVRLSRIPLLKTGVYGLS